MPDDAPEPEGEAWVPGIYLVVPGGEAIALATEDGREDLNTLKEAVVEHTSTTVSFGGDPPEDAKMLVEYFNTVSDQAQQVAEQLEDVRSGVEVDVAITDTDADDDEDAVVTERNLSTRANHRRWTALDGGYEIEIHVGDVEWESDDDGGEEDGEGDYYTEMELSPSKTVKQVSDGQVVVQRDAGYATDKVHLSREEYEEMGALFEDDGGEGVGETDG